LGFVQMCSIQLCIIEYFLADNLQNDTKYITSWPSAGWSM
jgi:hypothetical protein